MNDSSTVSPELERFRKYMPKGKDPILLVLRIHLLAETEINEIIERHVPNHKALKKARFTFVQKLRIIEALSTVPEFLLLVDAIETLNELRNALAHKLDVPHFESVAQEFAARAIFAVFEPKTRARRKTPKKEPYSLQELRNSGALVVGRLAYYKDVGLLPNNSFKPKPLRDSA